ncbi:MAG: branched-chain amino acid ABC transporter permease [Candidatus Bathyarchaeota archaeon]|nr:branched-chain amino acid ABC transporter permease [Candidatus Bathyarchaeota archaeon]
MIELLMRILVYGATLSGIYALIASGFTLIFGVSRIMNFAHGAFFILGAYFGIALIHGIGLNPYLSTIISILMVGLLAAAMYKSIISPVREHEVMVIIVTLAFALIVEQVILLTFGEHGISFPSVIEGVVIVGTVLIPSMRLFVLAVAIIALIMLWTFIGKTRLGKEITAASQDAEAAMLIGLDVGRLLIVTVFISAILAALGGVLYAQVYAANPFIILKSLIFAFAIVILGGLGSVKGSIIASFIVGYILTAMIVLYGARWSELVALLIIIAILVLRPAGLLGAKEL